MNELVKAEAIGFSNQEIKVYLERMDTNRSFKVNQLVFYPYFFFEYELESKSFFHPIGGAVGCTVDGVNGVGAVIDISPEFKEQEITAEKLIQKELDTMEAKGIAEKFLYNSISYKMKVLSMPRMKLIKQEVFYRPYWIAEGGTYSSNQFLLTVDAVTGKYHPL
ncbi:hypothetical protein CFK37_09930 [Virgibacillus phasianinus]|uniref:Uncharacterized protein n=1 Tax=Virgibacillus phasianinus TaxID=2017483 RepID=A0A220U2Y3_9BACI|nr:hypothetical protein [Virgibacillus phasianinus]ASK62447.1 hypothetical protein CFK37_09930 [Virgibacillus phasianinus]